VARELCLPDAIAQAVAPVAPGSEAGTKSGELQTRLLVSFSNETAACIAGSIGRQRERLLAGVLRRYGEQLKIERATLGALTQTVGRDTLDLTAGLGLSYLVDEPEGPEESDTAPAGADEAQEQSSFAENPDSTEFQPSPPPTAEPALREEDLLSGAELAGTESARTTLDILLNYVREIVGTMANGNIQTQEVLALVLEALFRGMRFKRVLACLRDPVRSLYRCRAALGTDRGEMLANFQFPLHYSPDLFHAALAHGSDVHISNAAEEKIAVKLPGWHRRLLPNTRSFLLLPLVLNKQAVGFIYADSDECDTGVYAKQEIDLARTLRSQVLLALRNVERK
jgi:hypothetical protein